MAFEDASYFLPKRIDQIFTIIDTISGKDICTIDQLMKVTGLSRTYIQRVCSHLKARGVLESKIGQAGGYTLVNGGDTTVADIIEAISHQEDRSDFAIKIHQYLMNHAQKLTLGDLVSGD